MKILCFYVFTQPRPKAEIILERPLAVITGSFAKRKAMQGSVRPRSIALRFIFTSSLLLAAGMACARAPAIPAAQEQVFDYKTLTITQLSLKQGNRAPVRYYLSKPARKAPLVLFIQGSGCIPTFAGLGTPTPSSTLYSWIPFYATNSTRILEIF